MRGYNTSNMFSLNAVLNEVYSTPKSTFHRYVLSPAHLSLSTNDTAVLIFHISWGYSMFYLYSVQSFSHIPKCKMLPTIPECTSKFLMLIIKATPKLLTVFRIFHAGISYQGNSRLIAPCKRRLMQKNCRILQQALQNTS